MKKLITLLAIVFCFNANAQSSIITTVAGNGTMGYSGDGGTATAAAIWQVAGLNFDASGNMFIADASNNRVRKINTSGIITTVAGNGTQGLSGDGGAATDAEMYMPSGVAIDNQGNLFVVEAGNNRIRKINTSGIITTYAGSGLSGTQNGAFSGDGGQASAAQLNEPYGVAVDANNNIYVADTYNSVIRKINTLGIITTIAGNNVFGYTGDNGQAIAASLYEPYALTFDAAGNLYIADKGNNCVRKVNSAGIITTVAGNGYGAGGGLGAYSGDGGQATAAELNYPQGLVCDASGNLYIADYYNARVRMVNTSGIISTMAGIGTAGYTGDGGLANAAKLSCPYGLAFDQYGSLYIADCSRIRSVCTFPNVSFNIAQDAAPHTWDVYPTYPYNINPNSTLWYWGDGSVTGGLYPSHTYSAAGSYTICVNASCTNGCGTEYCLTDSLYRLAYSSNSNMVAVNVLQGNQTTNVNLLAANNNQVTVYPNPSSGSFIIETNNTTKQALQIFDVNGKLVLTQAINGKTILDATNLADGVYNLSLINSNGIVNKRLVIVK